MQTAGYNGACIVVLVCWFDSKGFIQHTPASGKESIPEARIRVLDSLMHYFVYKLL